jgi:hypothetical protein
MQTDWLAYMQAFDLAAQAEHSRQLLQSVPAGTHQRRHHVHRPIMQVGEHRVGRVSVQ